MKSTGERKPLRALSEKICLGTVEKQVERMYSERGNEKILPSATTHDRQLILFYIVLVSLQAFTELYGIACRFIKF